MRLQSVPLVLALGLLAGAARAQAVDPTKAALIQRVLDVTKSVEVAVTAMEASLPAQRQATPQIPAEFWDEFAKRARQDSPRLIQLLIPIYDRQFTAAQLRDLLAFYQSPLGQHLIRVQPVIATQSIQAGQQWGAQLGAEIAQELQKRGVRMPPE